VIAVDKHGKARRTKGGGNGNGNGGGNHRPGTA
jgi:hypothetical protein